MTNREMLAGLMLGVVGFTGRALAEPVPGLYAVDNIQHGLIRIDPTTGKGVPVGPTGVSSVIGLAHEPVSNTTYLAGASGSGGWKLYTVDLESGATTEIGPLGIGVSLKAFSRDGQGSLQAIQNGSFGGGNPGDVYSIDPATGAATPRGNTGFGNETVYGASFDPRTSRVWFSCAVSGNVYSMDPGANPANFEFNARFGSFGMEAIAFGPGGGLFGVLLEDGNDSLYAIDRDTGALTRIGSTNFDQILSMTYVPAPGALALAVLAAMPLGRRRR